MQYIGVIRKKFCCVDASIFGEICCKKASPAINRSISKPPGRTSASNEFLVFFRDIPRQRADFEIVVADLADRWGLCSVEWLH